MKIQAFIIGILMAAVLPAANAATLSLEQIQLQEIARTQATLSLINWKVGDAQDFKVTLGGFGLEGTMHKEVTKDEGTGVWFTQQLTLPIMNDKSEILMDRNSGKVLKYIHNGKEEQLPDDKVEIISTNSDVVEVPAGKFKVMHVVAKSKNVKQIEIWMNPRDISMDGTAKMLMDQGQIKITMELTKFVKN